MLGVINEDRLRELLTTMGDRFTDDEVLATADVVFLTKFALLWNICERIYMRDVFGPMSLE